MNIYVAYDINLWLFAVGKHFSLEYSLFGAVKLAENTTDFDK